MISLSGNKTKLYNIGVTIKALEDLDKLIAEFSKGGMEPVSMTVRNPMTGQMDIQLDRDFFVTALKAQKQTIVVYLQSLGIDATK